MRRTFLIFLIAVATIGMRQGVPPGFSVKIDELVEGPAAAGSTARVALRVSLPEGFHIQSNQPRDPTLIPTVLSVEPPPGVRTDLEILNALAARLNRPKGFPASARTALSELRTATAGAPADYSGITLSRIDRERGVFWPCPSTGAPGMPRLLE